MSQKKVIRTVIKTRRKPRQHIRHTHMRQGKPVKQSTVNKGVKYKPKTTKTKPKTALKKQVKKQVTKVEKDKAKEAFNDMLHQQIMENNKELRETVKKLYMVEKDEDRLQDKLLKIKEGIIYNEALIKERTSPKGIKGWNDRLVGKIPLGTQGKGKPFTLEYAKKTRIENLRELSNDIEKYHEKAFPIRKKLLEREKQTNILQGQRNGLKAHLAYLQSYKASVKKEKEDWVSKSEGNKHEVENITLF